MEYYDKYFREYKEAMKPIYEWKKTLDKKDQFRLWGSLIGGIVLLVCEIIGMIIVGFVFKFGSIAVLIGEIVLVCIFIATVNFFQMYLIRKINKYKAIVAERFEMEDFDQFVESKERCFVESLKASGIERAEQYQMICGQIDNELKNYKPKRLINYGVIGALILPFWNTAVQAVFKQTDIITACVLSITVIGIMGYIVFVYEKIGEVRLEFSCLIHEDFYKLKGMKDVLMDIELKSVGNK